MPSVSCFTALTNSIAQGIDHLQQHNPFSQSSNHTAPIDAQSGHPAGDRNAHGIRQRGREYFAHVIPCFRRKETAVSPNVESIDATSLQSAARNEIFRGMRACLASALIPPQPGEQQQPIDEVWAAVYQFDANRCSDGNTCELKRDFPELDAIAHDDSHPSCADAKLFKDIMTRPVGAEAPSLEEYLAKKVEAGLDLDMEIPPNPDFRTFNSIQPGLATSTLDYNSAGRTLLFNGATYLIGIPSGPMVTDSQLTEAQSERKSRLQKTVFSFPKFPANGVERLKLSDFDAMIDPLDDLDVYESSGPQLP